MERLVERCTARIDFGYNGGGNSIYLSCFTDFAPSTTALPKNDTLKSAVLLTALNIETCAVLRHLPGWTEVTVKGTVFYQGQFEGWNVAVAEVGAGNTRAATIAERAIEHFKPTVALFVGVAGGVKDVALGDVVVATKVYGYESGKDEKGGFKLRPDVQNSAHALEQRGRVLLKRHDWQRRLNTALNHVNPRVFVGPIAAGERVVASKQSATAKFLRTSYGDTLAVEMEGRGFLEGVHINAPVEACVIRGISDLLSGKSKSDESGSQERAADVASAAAFEILAGLNPGASRQPSRAPFQETPTTITKATFFQPNEVLTRVGVPNVDEVLFGFSDSPDAYLRIIPIVPCASPISFAALNAAAPQAPLLKTGQYGCLNTVNRYGAIAYDPGGSRGPGFAELSWATQLFRNGELWCVSKTAIVRERRGRPAWIPIPFIPALLFERLYYDNLRAAIAFAIQHLGLTFPCNVEFGLIRLQGVHVCVNNEDIRGPIQVDEVVCREELASGDPADLDAALLKFFDHIYDVTGYARPAGLHNFPPGPPRS
jgi:nucleoside phosphorylase